MDHRNLLRNQVLSERRKRNRIFFLLFFMSMVFILYNLIFDDMGIRRYVDLKRKGILLEKKIRKIQDDTAKLKDDINRFNQNPFYIERQAREDLELARPDEYIFRYKDKPRKDKEE